MATPEQLQAQLAELTGELQRMAGRMAAAEQAQATAATPADRLAEAIAALPAALAGQSRRNLVDSRGRGKPPHVDGTESSLLT